MDPVLINYCLMAITGISVLVAILAIYYSPVWVNRLAAKQRKATFKECQQQMPEVLEQIRIDLEKTPLSRSLVIVPMQYTALSKSQGPPGPLCYFNADYPQILQQLNILANHKVCELHPPQERTFGIKYLMTEELVGFIRGLPKKRNN
jgi:hypothetical protein